MNTGTLFDMMDVYGRPALTDAQGKPKPASVRNLIGDVAELFACHALGLARIPIDGNKELCHDAEYPGGTPVEIKSVGKNDRALIYKWRLEKELAHHGRQYRYVFVRHACPVTMAHGAAVADYFRDHPPALLITSLDTILTHAIKETPPRSFRIHTGEKGTPIAPPCKQCHGNPTDSHLSMDGVCSECGTPPAPKFDRHTMHGSQRKGYVDGGWQFSLKAVPRYRGEVLRVKWRGREIEVSAEYA